MATPLLDETHDPSCVSWVESANAPDADFPLANLPFGVFRHDYEERPRVGIAIGNGVLDCLAAARAGLFGQLNPAVRDALASWTLNPLMALGRDDAREVRRVVHRLLRADTAEGTRARALAEDIIARTDAIGMRVSAEIGDFMACGASEAHAANLHALIQPGRPRAASCAWMPASRFASASGVVPTGTPVRRPRGQLASTTGIAPSVAASARVDYELALGAYIARGNQLGEPVTLEHAESHLFGLCLMNNWTARDLQQWDAVAGNAGTIAHFATSVSPWVVTLDALEPFRVAPPRADVVSPYLDYERDRARGGFAITLEAALQSLAMRLNGQKAEPLSTGDAAALPWTFAQLLTHLTSTGGKVRPGDVIASGPVSGARRESGGCFLDRTAVYQSPVRLANGETRMSVEDGDEIRLRGWCEREGFRRIGFGSCVGEMRPALA